MAYTGTIVSIETTNAGSSLTAAAGVGDDTVFLESIGDFGESGQITLTDWSTDGDPIVQTVDYDAVDVDAGTLTLVDVLADDFAAGTEVVIQPVSPETTAYVRTDDSDEPLPAIVTQELRAAYAVALADGIYDNGASVTVEEVGGRPYVQTVIGVRAQLSGDSIVGSIPPGTLPPTPDPTEAPSVAPVLTVGQFAIGALKAKWTEVPLAQWYDVYASLSSGFDSDDVANRVATGITSLEAMVSTVGGVQIPVDGTPVYVVVKAVNVVDSGPPSNEASGSARQADQEFISALLAFFGTIEGQQAILGQLDVLMNVGVGGVISVGPRITIADPDAPDGKGGIIIWGDDAHTIIKARFHPDGNYLDGILVAQEITVIEALRLIGIASTIASGAKVKLENGIADPPAPTLSAGSLLENWPAVPAGYTERSMCWDSTNNQWWQLLSRNSDKGMRVRTISTAGVASGLTALTPAGTAAVSCNSIAWSPSNSKLVVGYSTNSVLGLTRAFEVFNTSGSSYLPLAQIDGAAGQPIVGADATHYFYSTYDDLEQLLYRWKISDSTVDYWDISGDAGSDAFQKNILVGNFDLGTYSLAIVEYNGAVINYTYNVGAGTLVRASSKDFNVEPISSVGYRTAGTTGFYSSKADNKLARWSSYFPTGAEKWWAQYVDTGAGGVHTAASPESAGLAVPARRFVTVTLNAPPAGVSGADVYVGYGTATPGAVKTKRSETLVDRTMTLTSGKVTTGVRVDRQITNKALTSNVATLTSAAHGFIVGEPVTVAGVDATFNGLYVITAVTTNTFSYAKTAADVTSAAATGTAALTNTMGGSPAELYDSIQSLPLSAVSLTSGTATVSTAGAHGFAVNQRVVMKLDQAWPSKTIYNGSHIITAVPTTTTFQFALAKPDSAAEGVSGLAEIPFNSWQGQGLIDLQGSVQPHTRRKASGTQTLTTSGSTYKLAVFQTAAESTKYDNGVDDDIAYNPANGEFTVRRAGLYDIVGSVRFAADATGVRQVSVVAGGVTEAFKQNPAGTANVIDIQVGPIPVRLDAGDVVYFNGLQNSGGSLDTVTSGTWAAITRRSA